MNGNTKAKQAETPHRQHVERNSGISFMLVEVIGYAEPTHSIPRSGSPILQYAYFFQNPATRIVFLKTHRSMLTRVSATPGIAYKSALQNTDEMIL